MRISLYLHPYITDILTSFGTLPDVINKIVDNTIEDTSISVLPVPPGRDGARRYNINITNETYNRLALIHGANSTQCSIRRLIYWFVENEMYDQLGWTTITYNDKIKEYINNRIANIRLEVNKLYKCTDIEAKQKLKDIDMLIIELEGIVNGEPNN